MALSSAQQEAVHFHEGPAMVLAGPGSGKTMVITHRVRALIEEHGVSPSDILVITFTKSAAVEMEERFTRLMGGQHFPVTFGTFHAVFFRILKYAYHFTGANIARQEQQISYLREILDNTDLDIEDEGEKISGLLAEISLVKGDGVKLENYYSQNCPSDTFRDIYAAYEDHLRRASLIDFDDMMTMCLELFEQRPDILQAWQKRYRYILIDEFQDINQVQYRIVRMLAEPENNLFIVGDDDQSIYRFRGARPEIMLGFPKDYPDCHNILLDKNYRSAPDIVMLSGRVIAQNNARFPKKITAAQNGETKVTLDSFPDILTENEYVMRMAQAYHRAGIAYEDMALLYRTNSSPRVMAEQLMRCHMPFRMNDVVPNLYEHWISQDVLTYMLIAAGSRSRGDFLRIINRPKRYLSRSLFQDQQVDLSKIKEAVADKDWILDRVDRLEYDFTMLAKMKPWAAVNYIRHAMRYEEFVQEYAQTKKIRAEELMDVLDELQESARPFATLAEWLAHMREYSEALQNQQKKGKQEGNGIEITTMHSSKGLEYKVVFLMDANEGITPHRKAVLEADIEEERRLFYVAMTRAKTYLHISYVRERFNREMAPSRFVRETGLTATEH